MMNESSIKSTHSRNYLGYLTIIVIYIVIASTHSRNYLGYLTTDSVTNPDNLHTVEII